MNKLWIPLVVVVALVAAACASSGSDTPEIPLGSGAGPQGEAAVAEDLHAVGAARRAADVQGDRDLFLLDRDRIDRHAAFVVQLGLRNVDSMEFRLE